MSGCRTMPLDSSGASLHGSIDNMRARRKSGQEFPKEFLIEGAQPSSTARCGDKLHPHSFIFLSFIFLSFIFLSSIFLSSIFLSMRTNRSRVAGGLASRPTSRNKDS